MAIKYGKEYEYANEKLWDSFVEYDGKIVRVAEVRNNGECALVGVTGRIYEGVPLEDINTEPVRLGYVNLLRVAGYVSRLPARHYRQGFRSNTICVTNHTGRLGAVNIDYNFELAHLNKFPALDRCIELVMNRERESSAFSKIFSVFNSQDKILLEYKAKKVGTVDTKRDEVVLDNKFLFLEDVLKPCL